MGVNRFVTVCYMGEEGDREVASTVLRNTNVNDPYGADIQRVKSWLMHPESLHKPRNHEEKVFKGGPLNYYFWELEKRGNIINAKRLRALPILFKYFPL